MVHRKYIKKGGKIYRPYLYENKRVNGKVVSRYIGRDDRFNNKIKLYLYYWIFFAFFAGLFVLIYGFYFGSPLGKVAFDIETNYFSGESINGIFKINLNKGEFIPADSKIRINLGSKSAEYNLKELIELEENSIGYGVEGEKAVIPEIEF